MINYFDLGANAGGTVRLMRDILKRTGEPYCIYAFEPMKKLYINLCQEFVNEDDVHIYQLGIADKSGKARLFHCKKNTVGHSLFDSKNNVEKDDFEDIETVAFSRFLYTIPRFRHHFNILKANIEGAEFYLYNDLVESKLVDFFQIFCGVKDEFNHPDDIGKIASLQEKIADFRKRFDESQIVIHRFTDHSPELNADIEILIQARLNDFIIQKIAGAGLLKETL